LGVKEEEVVFQDILVDSDEGVGRNEKGNDRDDHQYG
jgi:hypothetical protein